MPYTDYMEELKRIELSGGYWAEIPIYISYGENQKLTSAYTQIMSVLEGIKPNPADNLVDVDLELKSGNIALLAILIKKWNIDGKEGILPINTKTVQVLSEDDANLIITAIQEMRDQETDPKVTP